MIILYHFCLILFQELSSPRLMGCYSTYSKQLLFSLAIQVWPDSEQLTCYILWSLQASFGIYPYPKDRIIKLYLKYLSCSSQEIMTKVVILDMRTSIYHFGEDL